MTFQRHKWISSSAMAICAMACATEVQAQQPAQQSSAAAASPDTQADNTSAGDIIVTAQRRQERALDVPISITSLSSSQLAERGVTNTADLSQLTPGLRIDHNGPYTQPALRGISSTLTQAGTESPVAIYVDGVYQLSQSGLTFELPDVRSIEVLKGPQGTLFGRNATGGAIQIFTLDPEDHFSGKIFSSYGNYNDVRIDGFVTAPLAEGVSFSLSGSVHNSDGYLTNLVTNKPAAPLRSHLLRGKLRFQPTSNLNIIVTGFYAKRDSGATAAQPLNGNTIARFQPGVVIATRPYDFSGTDPIAKTENFGGSLKAELETGVGTFSALSAYSKWKTFTIADLDRVFVPNQIGVYAAPDARERVLSQELNFASRQFGRLSFVAGLYYYDAYGKVIPQQTRGDFPSVLNVDVYADQPIKAAAAYGEFNYEPIDGLHLIGGLRYSTEKRSIYGKTVVGGTNPGLLPFLSDRRDSSVTPKASVRYEIGPRANIYFTFSRGFKSGAFNTTAVSLPIQTVAPETVTAYEVGSKSRFGSLSLNVAGYYYDYKNLQVSAGQIINNVLVQRLQNAASARVYGLDLEADLSVTDALNFSLGVSLMNAKYTSFLAATINVPRANGAGNATLTADASGNYLNRAPKATINLSGRYKTEFAGGDLIFSPSVYYSSRYFFEASNRIVQPGYVTLDANASWTPANSNLTFSIYGKNLTQKAVLVQAFPSAFSDAVSYSAPRTYGISAAYKF